jgi:hypothetical protein
MPRKMWGATDDSPLPAARTEGMDRRLRRGRFVGSPEDVPHDVA